MDPKDRMLLRYVTGELTPRERRELEGRLEADDELQGRLASLRATWDDLDLPDGAAVPGDFAARIAGGLAPAVAPSAAWRPAVATMALLAGLAIGGWLEWRQRETPWQAFVAVEPSLADSYFEALQTLEDGIEEAP